MSGSQSSQGSSSDREFESQGQKKDFGGGIGHEAGGSKSGTGSKGKMDDDEMNTAGGRQGGFSDKDRGKEGQWSPGSSQSSDQ